MFNPLERDGLKDKAYIEQLENWVKSITDKGQTRLYAYFGLKQYIETNCILLSELELAPTEDAMKRIIDMAGEGSVASEIEAVNKNIADFEDRKADKMLKFSEKLNKLLEDLDVQRKSLEDLGYELKEEEKKFINENQFSPEKRASGN